MSTDTPRRPQVGDRVLIEATVDRLDLNPDAPDPGHDMVWVAVPTHYGPFHVWVTADCIRQTLGQVPDA